MIQYLRFSTWNWDAVGIGASSLCVVHCLLIPIILAFAPAAAHFQPGSETLHHFLAYVLTAVGLLAFRAGYRVHRKRIVVFLLLLGIVAITLGAYAPLPSHIWEISITFIGSSFMIFAHRLNRHLCDQCGACLTCDQKHNHLE